LPIRRRQRGSALLFVLWVSAALAAIAFSLSSTVLGETQRTSTDVDGLRAYYLAVGGLERAEYERLWVLQGGDPKKYLAGISTPHVEYAFPSGQVGVDIIPEAAKLDINGTPPEELYRMLEAMGLDPAHAGEITAAILDWRSPAAAGPFDAYYLSLTPSFRARHASFEEIEELLSVKGITPELFYGTYVPAPEGTDGPRLLPRTGLIDCVSVFGSRGGVDVNTAAPPVLAAIGLTPDAINILLQRRRGAPLTQDQLSQFLPMAGPAGAQLRIGGNSIFTMKATGRLRLENGQLSDLRRSVGALVKYMPNGYDLPIHLLRWYDTAWSN